MGSRSADGNAWFYVPPCYARCMQGSALEASPVYIYIPLSSTDCCPRLIYALRSMADHLDYSLHEPLSSHLHFTSSLYNSDMSFCESPYTLPNYRHFDLGGFYDTDISFPITPFSPDLAVSPRTSFVGVRIVPPRSGCVVQFAL